MSSMKASLFSVLGSIFFFLAIKVSLPRYVAESDTILFPKNPYNIILLHSIAMLVMLVCLFITIFVYNTYLSLQEKRRLINNYYLTREGGFKIAR